MEKLHLDIWIHAMMINKYTLDRLGVMIEKTEKSLFKS